MGNPPGDKKNQGSKITKFRPQIKKKGKDLRPKEIKLGTHRGPQKMVLLWGYNFFPYGEKNKGNKIQKRLKGDPTWRF